MQRSDATVIYRYQHKYEDVHYNSLTRELHMINYTRNEISDDMIPADTRMLSCANNNIIKLPDKLPKRLYIIICHNNKLTHIKSGGLPRGLHELCCAANMITEIDPGLPLNLKILRISKNKLTRLPELPANLNILSCFYNKLTVLPDLPLTLRGIHIYENDVTLDANYPMLKELQQQVIDHDNWPMDMLILNFDYQSKATIALITYVNERNSAIRHQERTRIINANQCLLESYMRRAMHPARLAALADNDDLDVDEYMTAYVEAL